MTGKVEIQIQNLHFTAPTPRTAAHRFADANYQLIITVLMKTENDGPQIGSDVSTILNNSTFLDTHACQMNTQIRVIAEYRVHVNNMITHSTSNELGVV